MQAGVPAVVSATGHLPRRARRFRPADRARARPTSRELAHALVRLRDDPGLRARVGAAAAAHVGPPANDRGDRPRIRTRDHRDARARARPGSQGAGDLGQVARRRRHHRGDGGRRRTAWSTRVRCAASRRGPRSPRPARTSNDRHSRRAGGTTPVARLVASLTCGFAPACLIGLEPSPSRRTTVTERTSETPQPACRAASARALGLPRDPREPRAQGAEGQVHRVVPWRDLVPAEPDRVPGGVLVRRRGARQPRARLPRVPALGTARVEPVLGVAAVRIERRDRQLEPGEEGGVPARDPSARVDRRRARRLRAPDRRAAARSSWSAGRGIGGVGVACSTRSRSCTLLVFTTATTLWTPRP